MAGLDIQGYRSLQRAQWPADGVEWSDIPDIALVGGVRSVLLADIKRATTELVDERGVQPILLIDDAHLLHDDILRELAVLLNFDLDGRDLLTVWLIGHPLLERRLQMHAHAALAQRVVHYVRLAPKTDRAVFDAMIATPCPPPAPSRR